MFVVCPKCSAKYQIPPEITLKEGQKLQCSACKHIFNFQIKKDEIENESSVFEVKIPENPVLKQTQVFFQEKKISYPHDLPEAFKPLEIEHQKIPFSWLWVFIVLALFFTSILVICFYRDQLKVDYTSSSIHLGQSLPRFSETLKNEFTEDVEEIPLFQEKSEFVTTQCDSFSFNSVRFHYEGKKLLIEGMIHNNTNFTQIIPGTIYATAYNHQGKILFQKEIFLQKEVIQPYAKKSFFGTYSPTPEGVQWIEISCKD